MTSHVGGIFWAMYYGEENYSDMYFIPTSLDKPVTFPIILPWHYSDALLAQTINKLSEERTLEPSALIPTSFNRNKVSSETRKNVRTF